MEILYIALFLIYLTCAVGLSRFINRIVTGSISHTFVLFLIAGPGIIAHEACHAIACFATGAKILDVKLYDYRTGSGHVVHGPPRIPVIGVMVIALMPVIGIPLCILGLSWLCAMYLDLSLPGFHLYQFSWDTIVGVIREALGTMYVNIWENRNPWFAVYLYVVSSLLVGLSPSNVDMYKKEVVLGVLCVFIGNWAIDALQWDTATRLWEYTVQHLFSIVVFGISCEFLVCSVLVIFLIISRALKR